MDESLQHYQGVGWGGKGRREEGRRFARPQLCRYTPQHLPVGLQARGFVGPPPSAPDPGCPLVDRLLALPLAMRGKRGQGMKPRWAAAASGQKGRRPSCGNSPSSKQPF